MPSFGAQLKAEREKRKITLEEISQSTKIGTRMLHALEEEKLDQLPGGIFNKGFIRAYARFLGMDEGQLIAEYTATVTPGPVEKSEVAATVVENRYISQEEDRGLPWGAIALVLLVIALLFAGWGFYSREHHENKAPEKHVTPKEPSTTTSAVPVPATSVPAATSSSPVTTGKTSNPPASAVPPPAAGTMVVKVKAEEDSWVSITADGEKITSGTLAAQAERTVHAVKEVVVKTGNVGALAFEFNGKRLPPQGDYNEVRTITFNSNGLQQSPVTPAPTAPQP